MLKGVEVASGEAGVIDGSVVSRRAVTAPSAPLIESCSMFAKSPRDFTTAPSCISRHRFRAPFSQQDLETVCRKVWRNPLVLETFGMSWHLTLALYPPKSSWR